MLASMGGSAISVKLLICLGAFGQYGSVLLVPAHVGFTSQPARLMVQIIASACGWCTWPGFKQKASASLISCFPLSMDSSSRKATLASLLSVAAQLTNDPRFNRTKSVQSPPLVILRMPTTAGSPGICTTQVYAGFTRGSCWLSERGARRTVHPFVQLDTLRVTFARNDIISDDTETVSIDGKRIDDIGTRSPMLL